MDADCILIPTDHEWNQLLDKAMYDVTRRFVEDYYSRDCLLRQIFPAVPVGEQHDG